MAFNGSGTFVRLHNWVDDRNAAIKITADRHDEEDDGLAAGLSACITKNGESTTSALIPFAAGIGVSTGTVLLPGISFIGDTNTGIYRIGADNIGVAANGAKVLDIGTGGLGITGAGTITSAAASAFTVGANGATDPVFRVDAATASTATGIRIKGAAAAGGVAMLVLSSGTNEALTIDAKGSGTVTINGSGTGAISLARATSVTGQFTLDGTLTTSGAPGLVFSNDTDTGIYRNAADSIIIQTGGSSRIAVSNTGLSVTGTLGVSSNVDITGTLQVTGVATFSATAMIIGNTRVTITNDANDQLRLNRTTSSGTMMVIQNAGVTKGSISQDGTNTSYNTTSDIVLKEHIRQLTQAEVDNVIDRLKPSSYQWKATKTKGIGFIAQEYLPVIPWGGTARIGKPGDDNFQPAQVDYSSPTPFLVAEVQFLRKRVASLEAR